MMKNVVLEEFEAHVHDDYVPRGNTALFRCHVPSTLRQYLSVTSWTTEDGLVIGRRETHLQPSGKSAPRILKAQASVETSPGEDAEVPCLARGHPPPSTRWFRRSSRGLTPVASRPGTVHLPGLLVLRSAVESDQGRYTCLANNSVGEDRMDTELLVRRKLGLSLY
ncbi:hemicentin, putative [Ixodes scapularis]|uniref:Hemicentin, putative n=1 Tax=Ixodes scapularis TaxID=6945 RepID=B7QEU5_IXOSC|nr:hemicentin, putative [Ixodes scapularis]|eukprot:XP_002414059.1 hemicentin, putative [Ixodes scapularis]